MMTRMTSAARLHLSEVNTLSAMWSVRYEIGSCIGVATDDDGFPTGNTGGFWAQVLRRLGDGEVRAASLTFFAGGSVTRDSVWPLLQCWVRWRRVEWPEKTITIGPVAFRRLPESAAQMLLFPSDADMERIVMLNNRSGFRVASPGEFVRRPGTDEHAIVLDCDRLIRLTVVGHLFV